VLLLVCAGLFARTLHHVRALDLGLQLDGLMTFSADPEKLGYDRPRAHAYFRDIVARLRAVPGIEDAAYSWRTPYSNIGSGVAFTRAEGTDRTRHTVENNRVSPRYFRTIGTPLVAGRDFTDQDYDKGTDDGYDVVIVNRRLARELFPAGDAVGSHLLLEDWKGKRVEIVGIVGDVRGRPVTDDPEPCIYLPGSVVWGSVNVRSRLPMAQTAAAIREVARAIDPALPPYDVEPMALGVDRVISEQRLFARLSGLFAGVAALLAAIGIYGMMAGSVAERRREFGIRLALGAATRSVLTLVLRAALPAAVTGVLIGLAASLALRRAVESRLFGVRAWDPATLAAVTLSLLALALAASFIPALRASRVDPVQSLRAE
jgi:predicted permease